MADKALYLSKKFRSNKVVLAKKAVYVNLIQSFKLLFSLVLFLVFLFFVGYIVYTSVFSKTLGQVEVVLTYGGSMEGKIVYQDNKQVILQLEDGETRITILRSRIKAIKKRPPSLENK